jgi:signal transduction histidine kinase
LLLPEPVKGTILAPKPRESGECRLIQSAIRTIDPIAHKKSIQVKCEPTHATALIHVDRTKFRQIMLNLLSNGVKFTEPRGQISISSRINADGDLIISVKDTGIGIAPEHLHRVLSVRLRIV